MKVQAFEDKMGEEVGEEVAVEVEEDSPASLRCYSLSQTVREERRDMRFNRLVVTFLKYILGAFCLQWISQLKERKEMGRQRGGRATQCGIHTRAIASNMGHQLSY